MKELSVLVDQNGTVKVSVDGEKVGLLQDFSLAASADSAGGVARAVFRFPSEETIASGSDGLRESAARSITLARSVPWATVEFGDSVVEESPLIRYFSDSGTDGRGRTLSHIMSRDDSWFERDHDFVQWMLPTRRVSQHEPSSPVLSDTDASAFAARKDLRERYSFALDRFESFLGLDRMRPQWVRERDHNHKRISRMLESMRDLGFVERAAKTYGRIMHIVKLNPGVVAPSALEYWKRSSGG